MNPLTLSSICNFASGLLVAIFMFTRTNPSTTVVIWGFMGALTAFWGMGTYILSTTTNLGIAYIGWQIAKIASVLGPVVHHHFVLEVTKHNKKQLIPLYTIAIAILFVNFFAKEYFLGDLKFAFGQFYYIDWWGKKNILYLLYYIGFYWVLLFYSFGLILKYYKICPSETKNQLKYIILGSVTIWIGAHGDFPCVFGINLYPYSNLLFAFSPIIIGYGIVKHKTLDIEIVIQRGLVYSTAITIVSIIFLVLVLILERIFQNILGYKTYYASIISAILIAIIFTPLRNYLQKFIERYFFKGSTVEIAAENELLRQEVVKTDKFKTVSTLASGIAHEIKNPLTALKTFYEYYPMKKNDPAFMEKFHKLCSAEVDRIEQIVQELLEFAKPSALTLKEVNIQKIIEHGLNLTSSELSKHNIKVETHFTPNLPTIMADGNKILQVLINLILNAKDALASGGTLTVATTLSDHNIILTIADTGCGIAPKDLTKIFDPFYSTKEKGTGLGLSIVKGIIEDHGGKITVKSEVGKGTEFTITFVSSQRMLGSGDKENI